jgi:hypothetical protein
MLSNAENHDLDFENFRVIETSQPVFQGSALTLGDAEPGKPKEVIRLYQAGCSRTKIGVKFGVGPWAVLTFSKRCKVKRRKNQNQYCPGSLGSVVPGSILARRPKRKPRKSHIKAKKYVSPAGLKEKARPISPGRLCLPNRVRPHFVRRTQTQFALLVAARALVNASLRSGGVSTFVASL